MSKEIRAIITSFDAAQNFFKRLGYICKSEYAFSAHIFHPKNSVFDLNHEFVRARVFEKSSWSHEKVEVVHKKKDIVNRSNNGCTYAVIIKGTKHIFC
jgi:hypothetical protein